MLQPILFAALIAVAPVAGEVATGTDGNGCVSTGAPSARIAACTDAIVSRGILGGDIAGAYRLRALAHREAGHFPEAIADYDAVIGLQPDNAAILFERAGAYISLKDYDHAIRDYDRSLLLDPANPRAWFMRGISYNQLGQHPRAVDDYGKALHLDPEYSPVYNERAWTLYLLGRYPEALQDADRALSLRPRMAPAFDTRAHVLSALGRVDEALADFERAIDAGGRTFVRLYQSALARHGLYAGKVNGIYGDAVRDALLACLNEQCRLLK